MAKQFILGEKYPLGYNTYSHFGLNLLTNPETRTEICVFYYDRQADRFIYQFGYNVGQPSQEPEVHKKHKDIPGMAEARAYERDFGLNYGKIGYIHNEAKLNVTFAKTDPFNLFMKLEPSDINIEKGYFLLLFKGANDAPLKISRTLSKSLFSFEAFDATGGAIHAYNQNGGNENFSVLSTSLKLDDIFKENKLYLYEDICEGDVFCVSPHKLTYFGISSELEMNDINKIDDMERIFTSSKKKFLYSSTNFTTNYFNDIGNAICAPIYWNMSYNPEKKAAYLPVSKSWVTMMEENYGIENEKRGGPLVFNWDTAFASMIAAPFNYELAADLVSNLLSYIDDTGRIPQLIIDDIVSDRTNPPVITAAVWNAYLYTKDKEFLAGCYHRLKKYYNFLKNKRTGSKPYLLSWGADINEKNNGKTKNYIPGKVGAIYESGIDDSPMWDDFNFDPSKLTLDGDCVDLTSLTGYSAAILALMASELKIMDDYSFFANEAMNFQEVILSNLYDAEKGIFSNRKNDGTLSRVYTPTSFYPMLFIRLSREMKQKMNEHFKNPDFFGTIFKVMSLDPNHPLVSKDGDYWRGRIWPPFNYLAYKALRMQGMFRKAYELALSSVRQFQFEWQKSSHVHENYSSYTGFGEAQNGIYCRTSPFYTWGSLMGLMFLEEFFEIQVDGKFRLGSLFSLDDAKISGLRVGKNRIDVHSSPQVLELFIDRERKIKVSPCAMIFDYFENESKLRFKVIGRGPTQFKISKIGDSLSAYVKINGEIKCFASIVRSSPIVFEFDFGELKEDSETGEISQEPTLIEIEKVYANTRD